jgi:hypothetical protein
MAPTFYKRVDLAVSRPLAYPSGAKRRGPWAVVDRPFSLHVWTRLRGCEAPSIILTAMGHRSTKKPLALVGALGTMAAIWWYALRPRFRTKP